MGSPMAPGMDSRPAMMAQPTKLPTHDNPHSPASDATDRSRLKTATTGIRKFSVNNSERTMMTKRKPAGKVRPTSARPPYRRKPGAACSAGPASGSSNKNEPDEIDAARL